MKKILFFACLVCLLIVPPVSAINGDAWAGDMVNWDYRIPITITSAPTSADIQCEMTLTYKENMQADFDDLRFYTASGTEINYWIKEYTAGTSVTVWIKLPAANMQYVYVYYGNTAVTSTSNGENTFVFFDDFEDETVDVSKWSLSSGTATLEFGKLTFSSSTGGSLQTVTTYNPHDYSLSIDVVSYQTTGDGVTWGWGRVWYVTTNQAAFRYYTSKVVRILNSGSYTQSTSQFDAGDHKINFPSSTEVNFYDDDNLVNSYTGSCCPDTTKIPIAFNSIDSRQVVVDSVRLSTYSPAKTTFTTSILIEEPTEAVPTQTLSQLPHAAIQSRPQAEATISHIDPTGYNLLGEALGLNEQYNESAGTGQLDPKGVFDSSVYPFTGGEYGDYASLLIFAVPFLLAWMRQNSAIIPMSFGCILGTWMLWKLPAEWQLPATGMIILSMMGILYGIYKEKY